jgi:hypothetical protein
MTSLELYCQEVKWQGGTIHQAIADFKKQSANRQFEILESLAMADDNYFTEFFQAIKATKMVIAPPMIQTTLTGVRFIELCNDFTAILNYVDGTTESGKVGIKTPFNFMNLVSQVQSQRKSEIKS